MIRERKLSGGGGMRVLLKVSMEVPIGCTRDQCQAYVREAVRQHAARTGPWCEDFDLDPRTVVVERNLGRSGYRGRRRALR